MTYATSLSGTHKFNIYNQAWDRKTDTVIVRVVPDMEKVHCVPSDKEFAFLSK